MPWLSLDQLRDWQAWFDRNPQGEDRADLRQAVLLEHVLSPFSRHRPQSQLTWPYFGERIDPQEAMDRIKEIDQALIPKPGGGYQWAPASGGYDATLKRVNGSQPARKPPADTLA